MMTPVKMKMLNRLDIQVFEKSSLDQKYNYEVAKWLRSHKNFEQETRVLYTYIYMHIWTSIRIFINM